MIKIISGFPGIGKSYIYNNQKDIVVYDSDSSKFDKSKFPQNYIAHIKNILRVDPTADYIFVSSHKEVRDSLVAEGLEFFLVYPGKNIKDEYLKRYANRGSDDKFVKLLSDNWDAWIDELSNFEGAKHIVLQEGQFLKDVICWFKIEILNQPKLICFFGFHDWKYINDNKNRYCERCGCRQEKYMCGASDTWQWRKST